MENCCQECREKYGGDVGCYDNKTSASENKKTFRIEFKKKREIICRIKVDACVVDSPKVEKCDYVFVRCTNKEHYYVELKGSNIGKAYDQIVTTIKKHIPSPKEKNYGFIVCSKVPKSGPNVQNLKKNFKKKYGQDLEVKQNEYTHIID